MPTTDVHLVLRQLFSELADGAAEGGSAYILNSGDAGLLHSLEKVPAAGASLAVNGGATLAAHAQHLRFGLSLMNRWATDGGNPFADATWDEAWKVSDVSEPQWEEIRRGLQDESHRWLSTLGSPRDVTVTELMGMIASIAHVAYHLGAVRQIAQRARGPKEGTFA